MKYIHPEMELIWLKDTDVITTVNVDVHAGDTEHPSAPVPDSI